MKKLILVSLLLSSTVLFAQVPAKFKYQAILRNLNGMALNAQNVKLRISILLGTETGSSVYFEEHTTTTNAFGLISLDIGNGSNKSGSLSGIDWAAGIYYLKVEMSENGGSSFTLNGVSQLASVPYSLHSATSGDGPLQ